MKRDILTSSSLVHAESYTEVYLDNEEVGEIDDRSNTESEKQLNINTTPKPLHPIKDCPTCDSEDEEDYTQDILNVQSTIAQRTPIFTGLIATLLDSRLNKMHSWSEELQKKTIRICYEECNNIINETPTQSTHSNVTSTNHYFTSIFDDEDNNNDNSSADELDKYLDMPIASKT
ncbi:12317_t:CDS:2, partial [Cetraspora pellucida]